MKYLLLALLLSTPAFGQDVSSSDVKAANFTNEHWSKLGPTVEGSKGFTIFGRGIRLNPSGQYELWVKVVPANTAAFNRRYNLPKNVAMVLQYTTVDCEKKQLLFERTSLYDVSNISVTGNVSGLISTSKKDAVKPGSIGESVYKNVCVDPTTLPKSEQLKP